MDQLFCMRVFTRVVEHGSFAHAADALSVSRPTVTTAISQLEKHLGARLLHRTTRRLSLTDDGRSYYQNCVRILDELAEAEDALSSTLTTLRGRLRISVPQSFSQQRFLSALAGFMQPNPDLELELVLTDRAVNLVEEAIDCAVRAVEIPEDSTLVARRIARVHRITCASPGYLERYGTPETVSDLARHACIRFISPSTGRALDWLFKDNDERTSFTPGGRLGVTSMEAAVTATIEGFGIAQVPDALAHVAILDGRLRPILLDYVTEAPPVMVVYSRNRYLTAKVRAFVEFVTGLYPSEGLWPEIAELAAPAKATVRRRN
jgi:LysR family transcriptional regulator, regulator for bpeEF and oprC